MTLEANAVQTFDDAGAVFDFSRRPVAAPANHEAPLRAHRADPAPGWASRNPEKAMLFLFVTPRDGALVEELLSF